MFFSFPQKKYLSCPSALLDNLYIQSVHDQSFLHSITIRNHVYEPLINLYFCLLLIGELSIRADLRIYLVALQPITLF
jgi:hypothetical protein